MTGYNKAFIIDNETKKALIKEDPKSANLIKPVLKGKDIRRYQVDWAGRWLIDTHNGYGDVPPVNVDNYIAIKKHLDKSYPELEKRNDKGVSPYNLRNCAYHEEFLKEKLVWIELVETGRFCYDESGIYCEATCFIMTGESMKYLCALLNAKLIRWFFPQIAPTSGMGTLRWKKIYVETIPIPKISTDKQKTFIQLIDKILAAKVIDGGSDTSDLEAEIDHLVYELYGLNTQETTTIDEISYQK